jgi:hypothetical protein
MTINMRLLVAALFVTTFATCASADTTWTFSDVTFSDGDTLTGSFTTNSATDAIDSFSLVMTGPDAFTITQMVNSYLPGEIGMANGTFSLYVDLFPGSDLTSAGGTIALTGGDDCGIEPCGLLNTGGNYDPEINGVAPEPWSLLLFGTGLVAIMGIVRRELPARRSEFGAKI